MKKIVFIFFISFFAFAYEEPVSDQNAFDVLMFKMGVTSLIKDFEMEKENIANNTKDIEILKKEIAFLLQENLKLKFQKNSNTDLELQNELLKKQIETLKHKIDKTQQNTFLAKVAYEKASSVSSPYPNSKIVTYYYRGDSLEIESCNRYDWCKIKEKNEYIAKYKIYFVGE